MSKAPELLVNRSCDTKVSKIKFKAIMGEKSRGKKGNFNIYKMKNY